MIRRFRTPTALPIALLAASVVVTAAAWPTAARAQFMEPITLVGYWDATSETNPSVTGDVTLATKPSSQRTFGYVHVQSQIGTSGSDIFTRGSLAPIVNVRGPDGLIQQLDDAPEGRRIRIIGMFDVRSKNIILNGVEVAAPADE